MTTAFDPPVHGIAHQSPPAGTTRRATSRGPASSGVRSPRRRWSRRDGILRSGWVGVATWALATATGVVLRDEVPPDV